MKELLHITVPGVYISKIGAVDRGWKSLVDDCVRQAVHNAPTIQPHRWYYVEACWFVRLTYKPDLDNFSLKPVLDSLTKAGFWPDDNIKYVRRICSEAKLIDSKGDEHLEVTVFEGD